MQTMRQAVSARGVRSGVLRRGPASMSTSREAWRPLVRRVALTALLLASIVGVPATTPASAAVPGRFTGTVAEFYVVPDPLPAGEPGELIRVQDVGSGGGSTTVRVMYHSRDAMDRDRAVTGLITYPTGPAPDGGWPVISLAHGTAGLAEQCAPSRAGGSVPTFGVAGVGVQTDYIGLGPVGELHPYLSRPSEGHSVIDGVRAARNLTETGAGPRWLALGHSQGGHGALSAHELGESYAPELDLLGTVSMSPAAMFAKTYDPLDEIVTRIVGIMALYGAATEHPDLDPNDYVGPETAAASSVIYTGCLAEITDAFLRVPAETFYINDPKTTEPAASIMEANDVGKVAVDAPLLLVSGTADDRVVIARVRDLYLRLCTTGQVTEYGEYEGANHGTIFVAADEQVSNFLQARLAGAAPTDSCVTNPPPIAPVGSTSTTTTAVPSTSTTTTAAVAPATATPAFTG